MIDWNKRNGGFLDDFNVMNYQVSNLSQQIDKLKQELQRKDNIINELEKYIGEEWYCFDNESVKHQVSKDILDKLKELKENNNEETFKSIEN